jgi:sucrose phosphorylase
LQRWIEIRPCNAVTVLDTHDGIGVIDVAGDEGRAGLVPDGELARLVERIHANSRGDSAKATGAAAANLDLYQVNCTLYDALGRDDVAYLLCRAIQFFLPGVPQVYYVGLLAGGNDMELLARTGVGRDINRHFYTRAEIDAALARPVVRRLFDLIRLRSSHPAFAGEFEAAEVHDDELDLAWRNGAELARLHVNVRSRAHRLEYSRDGRLERLELGANG